MKKRLIAVVMIALVVLLGMYLIGRSSVEQLPPEVKIKEVKIDVSNEEFANRILALKNEVVDDLQDCERAGYSEDDGIIIFDSNEVASIGQLQFQKKTVIYYYKLLYGKDITGKEAVLLALDTKRARELAIDIMFKTKNKAGKDWVNCSAKDNLDARIDVIKKVAGEV